MRNYRENDVKRVKYLGLLIGFLIDFIIAILLILVFSIMLSNTNISESFLSLFSTITTAVYPGFPTDLQQPFTVLLTQCRGKSKVIETIWENRFMHIPYLNTLGADITVKNQTATILGPTKLKGTSVVATDLRAGAAMVVAGLLAEGKTTITHVEHILRGYEKIVEKLTDVGAKIESKEI